MNGPRHNEIPQDDGDDDNPNETINFVKKNPDL